MNWEKYIGFEVNIIMKEYYGVVHSQKWKNLSMKLFSKQED